MATNRNIVEMVEAIRRGSGDQKEAQRFYLASVSSVEPLRIRMCGRTIDKNLYLNPALVLEASDSGEKIKKIFQEPFEPLELYRFLKDFHESYMICPGDTVLVYLSGSSFYIVGKVAGL